MSIDAKIQELITSCAIKNESINPFTHDGNFECLTVKLYDDISDGEFIVYFDNAGL